MSSTDYEQSTGSPLKGGRAALGQLRAEGEIKAPATLLPAVMTRLGLGDAYTQLTSPAGLVFVAYNPQGIAMVALATSSEAFEQTFNKEFQRRLYYISKPPAFLVRAANDLRYVAQHRSTLNYDLRGLSEFERAVLLQTSRIPYGEIRSYAWIAREIGRPRAVRAVGSALRRNPVPLFIPCHRVVRSDGALGNYSLGGPEMKRTVLRAEGVDIGTLEMLLHSGVRYVGSDTTHIYCFPTCQHARRITEQHRVPFSSAQAAAQSGYRPCKRCRPLANAS